METPNKPSITPVPFETLKSIVDEVGLPTTECKSGWLKVQALKGESRLYIAMNKTKQVRQVDVSAMKVEDGFGIVPPKKKNGKVVGHLDQTLAQEDILANFRALCLRLAAGE